MCVFFTAKLRGDKYFLSPVRGRSPNRRAVPRRLRGISPTPGFRSASNSPDRFMTTHLDVRPRSPSPRRYRHEYCTTRLEDRSRSPSPIPRRPNQHSYPMLPTRRGAGRRLPPTPNKPSTLHLSQPVNFPHLNRSPTVLANKPPSNINFPKLNASPTHGPKVDVPLPDMDLASSFRERQSPPFPHSHPTIPPPHMRGPSSSRPPIRRPPLAPHDRELPYSDRLARYEEPLSFEQAMAIGRGSGGRQLPSPVPNGYKPGQRERERLRERRGEISDQRRPGLRHSDSDEDDWC